MCDVTLCLLTQGRSQTQHNNKTAVFDCSPLSVSTKETNVNDFYAFGEYFIFLLLEFYKFLQLNMSFKRRMTIDICNSFISPHQEGPPRLLHIRHSICNGFYTYPTNSPHINDLTFIYIPHMLRIQSHNFGHPQAI